MLWLQSLLNQGSREMMQSSLPASQSVRVLSKSDRMSVPEAPCIFSGRAAEGASPPVAVARALAGVRSSRRFTGLAAHRQANI